MSCDVPRDTTRNKSNNMIYKTRKSITCNDVYQDNRDAFVNLKNCKELADFLQKKALTHAHLYHLTTMDKFAKMCRSNEWRFSSVLEMNDLQEVKQKGEKEKMRRLYAVSFSHGDYNNIGMWKMYGGSYPRESICLEFPSTIINRWKDEINLRRSFGIKKEYTDTLDIDVSLHDIAYIHGWQRRNGERVCWGNVVNYRMTKDTIVSKESVLTGFVKNSAWEQEKESRITIELPLTRRRKYISVPIPSYLLDCCVVHFSPFANARKDVLIQLLRIYFSINKADWPANFAKRCKTSYFRKLIQ